MLQREMRNAAAERKQHSVVHQLRLAGLRRVSVPLLLLAALLLLTLLLLCTFAATALRPASTCAGGSSGGAAAVVPVGAYHAAVSEAWEPIDAPTDASAAGVSDEAWEGEEAIAAARPQAAGPHAVVMSEIVVGLMTCDRFLPTRGVALRTTWLRRARRVLFFADAPFGRRPAGAADPHAAAVEAPLVRRSAAEQHGPRTAHCLAKKPPPAIGRNARLGASAKALASTHSVSSPPPHTHPPHPHLLAYPQPAATGAARLRPIGARTDLLRRQLARGADATLCWRRFLFRCGRGAATTLKYYYTTILPYYYSTILLCYYTAIVAYYFTTFLLFYCATVTLEYYTTSALLYYYSTVLLYCYNT